MRRILRGTLGVAILWGLAWLPVGLVLGILRILTLRPLDVGDGHYPQGTYLRIIGVNAGAWLAWGVMSGAGFSLVLALAERRANLQGLSLPRVTAWGAIGSSLLPLILMLSSWRDLAMMPVVMVVSIAAGMGSLCAAGTLLLARRTPHQIGA